jgi:hypothetical protein
MGESTSTRLHSLDGEQLLTFSAAARALPSRTGGRAHGATVWRWASIGAKSPTGERVRLERVRIGTVWYTSREAVARFLAALSCESDRTSVHPAVRIPTQRQRSHERATEELEKMGI